MSVLAWSLILASMMYYKSVLLVSLGLEFGLGEFLVLQGLACAPLLLLQLTDGLLLVALQLRYLYNNSGKPWVNWLGWFIVMWKIITV